MMGRTVNSRRDRIDGHHEISAGHFRVRRESLVR